MSPNDHENQREGATHRYEICNEENYWRSCHNIGPELYFAIYKYCFLPFFAQIFPPGG